MWGEDARDRHRRTFEKPGRVRPDDRTRNRLSGNQPGNHLSWHDSQHWLAEDEARRELARRSWTDSNWLTNAKCRGMNPNVFHPGRGESEIEAKAVCAACPVQLHCLRYALNASEHIGIWGSTSERQRRVLRSASRSRSNSEGITYAEAIDVEIRLWSKREALRQEAKQRERQESILEAQRLATEQPPKHVHTPPSPKRDRAPKTTFETLIGEQKEKRFK